ncbi:MAG TPA: amino acid adenylation domain-containing protein, partial [Thermoanaerobaculia bacterium]|nr:amino acid adenylation domain-containing protein [Thermoanaerobaculia bacterium]
MGDLPPGLAGPGVRLVRLDTDAAELARRSRARPDFWVPPESVAYVLFTSGSTGRPKGVVVEHRQLVSYIAGVTERLGLPPGASYATVSTFAADLGNTAVFPALTTGGCLHVIAQERLSDPEAMARYFELHAIDCLKIVPSHLEALQASARPERVMPRRLLVLGGEASQRGWIDRMQALSSECRILNHYGPTETTVGVLTHEVDPAGSASGAGVPLGRPLANTRIYVLDPQLEPAPTWVAGEIAIGGASVARGYLGRPDLTAERFLPDPWSERPGGRLYRTGDLGRCREEGVFEFLGRIDDQVKIRGFRVEPGEIEALLREHSAVQSAAVLLREDRPGQRRLAAYAAIAPESSATPAELTAFLAARLPDFMVPAAVVILPRLPLNPNGKVDRQRLQAPDERGTTGYVAPRTDTERLLADIWVEVLGVECIGIEDSFFRLGGDSIRSISLRGRALEHGLDFSVAELFEHPTIAQLAALIAERAGLPATAACRTAPFEMVSEEDRSRLPVGLEDAYPLTRLQAGMLFHSEYSAGTAIYHDIHSYHLQLPLDLPRLEQIVAELTLRHPVLRTSFDLSGFGEAVQLVHHAATIPVFVIDLRGIAAAQQEEQIAAWLVAERRRPLDWTRPPLMAFFIHRRSDDALQFTLSYHHSIIDGWSTASLTAELFSSYFALLKGLERPPEPPLAVSFRDFVALERQALASDEHRDFWRRQLAGRSVNRLPRWIAGGTNAPGEARAVRIPVPPGTGAGLKRLADAAGVPVKSIFLTAHLKVLAMLSGEPDVTTGLISNGRPEEADGDRVLGLFLNTVPLRLVLAPGRWIDLARAVFRSEQALTPYRRYPLAELQHVEGGEPLFDTAFNYVHYHVYDSLLRTPELGVLGQDGYEETNFPFEANFALSLADASVLFWLSYRTTDLTPEQIQSIAGYYLAVMRELAADPEAEHADFCPLSAAERHQVLFEWNDTGRAWAEEPTTWELVSAQAARTPEATAVVWLQERLSYREIMQRVTPTAARLAALGVEPGAVAAVLAERGLDFWLAALSVLAAGGAYLPLDPRHPAERQAHVVARSGVSLVLVAEDLLPGFERALDRVASPPRRLPLATLLSGEAWASVAPLRRAAPADLAYVIYTSGSTGEPKGVMVEQRGMLNHLRAKVEDLALTESDTVAQTASQCFDISVWQFLAPLLLGGAVQILPDEVAHEPRALLDVVGRGEVTILETVPSLLRLLLDEIEQQGAATLGSLRWMIPTGEALAPDLCRRWLASSPVPLLNAFGPTECSDDVSHHRIDVPPAADAVTVPIGRPVANLRLYVLDRTLLPVPIATVGELCVAGTGVGRGYLGEPARTAAVFVPDPFSAQPGARLYRTGDQGRWTLEGRLGFLGRLDHQVKIRGHRIELGEIEAALAAHPGVRETVVVAREEASGDKRLVAYVVAAREAELRPDELRSYLEERLPDSMIPSAFVRLDSLPLTANGKLDRRALPVPGDGDLLQADSAYVQPRNPDEEMLAGVWAAMLGRERVGAEDDFFALGGDSRVATRVVARVRRLLGLEVPLRDLFEAPTVAALSLRIAALRRTRTGFVLPPLVPVPHSGPLPLSFAQERLWFLDQLAPGNAAYHIHRTLAFEGLLDTAALERCLAEILRRHGALRTRFVTVGGVPAQEIAPARGSHLPSVDLSALPPLMREGEARRLAAAQAVRPFDLTRDLLLRVVLLRLATEEHAVLLTMHHIAGDGWSMGVLIQEVAALYAAFTAGLPSPLPELPTQYADFAQWQRQWLQGEVLAGQMAYWRTQLGEGAPASELPADLPRPAVQSFRGAARRFALSAETTAGLHALARREGVSLFMALLAAVDTVLHRYTGRDDIVVGSPIANRNFAEVEGLIGFFVNTLALRVHLGGEPSFRELLARTREVSLGAYAHQDLPFEKLVEELQPERDPSRNPLFQVMLTLQNAPAVALTLSGLRLKTWEVEHRSTRFDLELMLWEAQGGMNGSLIYARDLFDVTTAIRFGEHLRRILAAVAAAPDLPLSRLPLLSSEERFQVVAEWNDTATSYPQDVCLHDLIEAQVRRTPGVVAVSFEGRHLSYRDLDRAANALAHRLRKYGVGPEVTVGLCVERSLELVVGLLGILKAGGAYVPLDPSNPHERLKYLIQDSRVPVLLTQQHVAGGLPDLARSCGAEVFLLDGVPPAEGTESETGPASGVRPDNLAYMIYTSGSTGQPKGAMNTHRAIVNRLLWMQDAYGLTADDAVLQKTPFSFDVSVWEFFWPLLTGARLVVARPGGHQESAYLARLIASEGVTTVHFVPSMLAVFLEEPEAGRCRGLRRVIASGEALSLGLEQRFFARLDVPLRNLYGPTEAAVDVTAWACERGHGRAVVPIGRPISNLRLHILDVSLQPVPVGVPGELYIGGVGLARGYFARPALTAERFVPDPFATAEQHGGRLYWTGDLARSLADGSIDFLGRIDHQVKIRGFRIELGEIEAALLAHPAVRETAVVDREDGPGGRRLVAYVVPDPDWNGEEELSPEPAVANDQVSEWQALYDEVYSESAEAGDPTFDIRSWDSSYTGEPIPPDEMREWVERTVERILALRPRRVLEIGCGSGLLLYRVAPHCERYLGTDFSMAAVRRLQAQLARPGWELPQVELSCRTATDFTGIAEGELDLVILNSVVQYFPSGEYLLSVLEGAVRLVRPGGFVFVGDVRNLELLEAFHASVQLFQAPAALPVAQWCERVRRRAAEDRELVVAPAFWSRLTQHLQGLGEALVQVKRGRASNELTRFRYDVVLSRGERMPLAAEPKRLDWTQGGLDLAALGRWLAAEQPDAAVVTRVPNRRVAGDLAALGLSSGPAGPATTGELAELAQRQGGSAEADPEDLWPLAAELGYTAEIGWSAEDPGALDVVFRRPALAEWGVRAPLAPAPVVSGPLPGALVSRPLRVRLARRLVPELRSDLACRL